MLMQNHKDALIFRAKLRRLRFVIPVARHARRLQEGRFKLSVGKVEKECDNVNGQDIGIY